MTLTRDDLDGLLPDLPESASPGELEDEERLDREGDYDTAPTKDECGCVTVWDVTAPCAGHESFAHRNIVDRMVRRILESDRWDDWSEPMTAAEAAAIVERDCVICGAVCFDSDACPRCERQVYG